METKNGKQYLPQTYQAFLSSRKKNVKNYIGTKPQALDDSQGQHNIDQNVVIKKGKDIVENESDQQDQTNNINEVVQKMVYSDYQNMFDEFQNNKFSSILSKIKKETEKLKEQTPVRTISINTLLKDLSIQSKENLKNLQKELKTPAGRRNIEKIDNMLSFNKFFLILNRDKRFKIYDHCELITLQQGQQIYKQGQLQDFMYVVIKGCVKQFEKKSTSYQQKITVNFVSHYEGSSFGQSQLVIEKDQKAKRHHSTLATQKSFIIKIQNDFYRELITNSAEDDFEKKILSLLSTSIFCETSKIFVTPLLSTLQRKVLDYGQVLIRQGQSVNKLYFIGEGNLQIIYIDRSKRNVKHLNIEQKPRNFSMKDNYINNKKNQKNQKTKNHSIHQTFYYENQYNTNDKEFVYGHKKLKGDQLEYNDQIIFQQLRTGDFLGGKSFLSVQQRQAKAEKSGFLQTDLNSKLTVICSTTKTLIYSLDQKKFFSLSDNLQKVIIDGIIESSYFDQRDFESKITAQRQWKKYAQGLISHVITEKKSRNKSFRL